MKTHNHFKTTRSIITIFSRVIIGMTIAAGVALLFGFVVMWLWNWLVPDIFGLTKITFWQSWGLVVLTHILFKSFPHPNHKPNDRWKKHFKEKYCADTEGEKKQEPVPSGE